MAFRDVMRKFLGKDEEFAEMQHQDRIQTKVVERKKNSNERELERFQEEERQEMIKKQLAEFRQKKKDEFFHGPNVLEQKNLFNAPQTMLKDNKQLFKMRNTMNQPHGNFFK